MYLEVFLGHPHTCLSVKLAQCGNSMVDFKLKGQQEITVGFCFCKITVFGWKGEVRRRRGEVGF